VNKTSIEMTSVFTDAFHCHLDQCAQCREHPFELCEEGAILLRAAGIEAQRKLAEAGLVREFPA
jgi:hypothetical protein